MTENIRGAGGSNPVDLRPESADHVPLNDGTVFVPDAAPDATQPVIGGTEKVALRYVAWTVEEMCHIVDEDQPTLKTECGLTPRTGTRGVGRLENILFLESPGRRQTCERCAKVRFSDLDTQKERPKGRIISR